MSSINYINKFTGYQNYMDITNMPITSLAAGSQNVFVEDGAKLVPRAGMSYFGAAGTAGSQTDPYWTLAHRIHSKYDDFVNKTGTKIPLRVYYSGNTTQGDVIEAWLPVYVGGVATENSQWYQITADVPTTANKLLSLHRYYWAEWFDSATGVLQPELVFTFGGTEVGNWSGGFGVITNITATTIQLGSNWVTNGFIAQPEGINTIVVNGVEYNVSGNFNSTTITVADTTGISVGDIAFQSVYLDSTLAKTVHYDVCSTINNQVYYLDWNSRNVYVSWNRNQVAEVGNTIFVGTGIDDGIFSASPAYNGTADATFKVVISTTNTQSFISGGQGNLNDAVWDTTGYSGTVGVSNKYSILMVGDYTLAFSGPFTPTPLIGEVVIGGTSNAQGIVVGTGSFLGNGILGLKMLTTDTFQAGETVTSTAGSTGTVASGNATRYQNWIQFLKNGVVVPIDTGLGALNTTYLTATTLDASNGVPDGLEISFGNYTGHAIGDTFVLDVSGTHDTFQWAINNGALSSPIVITGGNQTLANNIRINFGARDGHTVGDSWTVTAYPTIIRGWSNFSYTNPNRRPGQGFTLLLDSNGWAMQPQESRMLINAQAGHFYDVEVILSSDLLGETVKITRLKSEPQNKVLFPYLLGYIKNQSAIISNEKTYDILGRQKFLELQQLKTLSDAVRIDFETVDWEDADILYFKRKIYFNIPRTTEDGKGACIFVWDDYRKYWHTPQVFGKRISLLSVIDNKLVGHSYEQNESYQLFTGLNDLGIFPIETKMVFPYDSSGNRYHEKTMDAIGFEGYILGNPKIDYVINADVGGCGGQERGTVKPWDTPKGLCIPADKASLGKSALGVHGLGNDPVDVIPHFFYIKMFDNLQYYQRNIELVCSSLEQRWSITSIGTSLNMNNINSESITDPT